MQPWAPTPCGNSHVQNPQGRAVDHRPPAVRPSGLSVGLSQEGVT